MKIANKTGEKMVDKNTRKKRYEYQKQNVLQQNNTPKHTINKNMARKFYIFYKQIITKYKN